ncbi:unnamed protein product [Linum trigynum]|uniref:SMP domain-containing protein n=1 Tax=Linum trigynum TaxID=586398 RepID=A0AAV2E9J4_9ROSI
MAEIQSSRSLGPSLAELTTDIEQKREAEAVKTLRVNSTTPEVAPIGQVPSKMAEAASIDDAAELLSPSKQA